MVVCVPRHSPGWGQAPALHLSFDLGCGCSGHSGWCRRPVPAGTGTPRYENWVHWLIEGFSGRLYPTPLPWLGTSPSPTSLLRPSAVIVRATVVGVPVPAGAGTPRYENWVHWLIEGFSGRLYPTPLPWLGTSPSPTSLLRPSAVVVRATVVGVAGRCRLVPESIPDRSPGHAFVPGSEFPAGDHLLDGGAHGPGLVAGFRQLLSEVGFSDPAVEVGGGEMIAG